MEETKNNTENQSQLQQSEAQNEGAKTDVENTAEPNPMTTTSAEPVEEKNSENQAQKNSTEEGSKAPIAQVPPFVARPMGAPITPTGQNEMNYQQMGDGIRKLRKIKRPVRRIPQGNPLPPISSSQQMINLDEDLDELLDSQLNLPVLNAAQQKTTSKQESMQIKGVQTAMPENEQKPQVRFISDSDLVQAPRFIDQLIVDNLFTYKGAAVIAGIVFVLTLFIGRLIFGGETIVKDGLQGVVVNAEVPRGRARCGVAERTQGCVLYIMNPQRQDLQGRDFYDLASQLTGRQRFVVETGNMRYSNVKIRAGEIAQINIPPLQ